MKHRGWIVLRYIDQCSSSKFVTVRASSFLLQFPIGYSLVRSFCYLLLLRCLNTVYLRAAITSIIIYSLLIIRAWLTTTKTGTVMTTEKMTTRSHSSRSPHPMTLMQILMTLREKRTAILNLTQASRATVSRGTLMMNPALSTCLRRISQHSRLPTN